MFAMKKILFPVDFSERCTSAARMVEAFVGHFQAELTILHVVEPLTYNELPNAIGTVEHQIKTYLADELKQFDVHRELVHGDPAEQIVQYAHAGKFDLTMLPTHGYGRFRRFIIGSVAAKVLHDADCPVWTGVHMEKVPRLEDVAFRHVACAIDLDNSQSCRALRWAMQFALEMDAQMTIIHAVPGASETAKCLGLRAHRSKATSRAKQKIEGMRDSIGSEAEISVVADEVPRAVRGGVENAKADLLVIGRSAEHGVIGRLRTNAYSIIRQSPCPVVSV